MENILFIVVLLMIGIGLKYVPSFPQNTAQVLTSFVLYVSLPALILIQIPKLSLSKQVVVPLIMPWIMIGCSALLVLWAARIFRWNHATTGSLLLVVPLGNTSFLGFPMIEAFFGKQHLSYAMLYDSFGTFLALATYGSVVTALYSKSNNAPTKIRDILTKVISFPPFIALIFALILPWSYPDQVNFMLESLANTLVPVVIVAVGLKIEFNICKSDIMPMIIGLTIKLCIAPLIALFIVYIFGITGPAARVAVFEAGMPPQISASSLAISVGLSRQLTAMMVGLGILLSFLTLPLLFQLL